MQLLLSVLSLIRASGSNFFASSKIIVNSKTYSTPSTPSIQECLPRRLRPPVSDAAITTTQLREQARGLIRLGDSPPRPPPQAQVLRMKMPQRLPRRPESRLLRRRGTWLSGNTTRWIRRSRSTPRTRRCDLIHA